MANGPTLTRQNPAWRHQRHGEAYVDVVGDRMAAASFAPDGWRRRFLKRVSAKLLAAGVSDEDCARAIEP